MSKVSDIVKDWPNWAKYSLAAVVVLLLGGGVIYSLIPQDKNKEDDTPKAQIVQTMPDGEIEKSNGSRLAAYMSDIVKSTKADDYWDSLGDDEGLGAGGLVVNGSLPEQSSSKYNGEYLDPNEYSELEIYYIKNNVKSKAEIDAQHLQQRQEKEEELRRREAAKPKTLTAEQQDSLYLARMEKAYELAAKYTMPQQGQPAAAESGTETNTEPEPEPRHIDLSENSEMETSTIDMDSFGDDGIITSLDEPSNSSVIHYSNTKIKSSPVKCTFLKTEKLVSGQRVIMRLMQDLILLDGTLIPANTHITGICNTTNRLNITVSSIQYGGKIYQTNIVAYDNDGTEGIYCPIVETKQGSRSSKRVASAAAGGVASAVLGTITGNPYISRVGSTASAELTRAIEDNGTTSVNVTSGYVFYLLESEKN